MTSAPTSRPCCCELQRLRRPRSLDPAGAADPAHQRSRPHQPAQLRLDRARPGEPEALSYDEHQHTLARLIHGEAMETIEIPSALALMALSMIISESLVARTFGTYTLQLFPSDPAGIWVPVLAVGLIVLAVVVNLAGNQVIGTVSNVGAVLKIGGLLVFAAIVLAASGTSLETSMVPPSGRE